MVYKIMGSKEGFFKVLISVIISILILPVANSENEINYNPDCTFYPDFNLVNYSMGILGTEEFDYILVENTRGLSYFNFSVSGNQTQYTENLHSVYLVQCDDTFPLRTGCDSQSRLVEFSNGSSVTEFTCGDRDFHIPKEKNFCHVRGYILARNETWENLNPNASMLSCWVNGLSGRLYKGDSKKIFTLEEFLLTKSLEEQKNYNWIFIIISVFIPVSVLLIEFLYKERRHSKRQENLIEILFEVELNVIKDDIHGYKKCFNKLKRFPFYDIKQIGASFYSKNLDPNINKTETLELKKVLYKIYDKINLVNQVRKEIIYNGTLDDNNKIDFVNTILMEIEDFIGVCESLIKR